ncbi:hypothetical protein V8G54_002789 [Vigna mungo]|uniref:Uncharacterized protein n=1 Tax=Vigna mungo TaxID=3915 RepID=A0AAQ3PBM0_VIGMU
MEFGSVSPTAFSKAFNVIPLGLSFRREISMPCISAGLDPLGPLPPGVFLTALFVLVEISFSETTLVSCLPVICTGIASSKLLDIFATTSGEEAAAKGSGGDGRGEECLPLVLVLVEVNPDLWEDFRGPPT